MLNYRASALRLHASQIQAREVDDPNTTLNRKLVSLCPCVFRNDDAFRSTNARSHRKRAVLYMALGYSLTWALIWIPLYIVIFSINNKATGIVQAILTPLQGLCTLIVVYMSTKVRNARNTRTRGKLPWCQAIAKAWMSKGEKNRAIVGRKQPKTAIMWQRFQNL